MRTSHPLRAHGDHAHRDVPPGTTGPRPVWVCPSWLLGRAESPRSLPSETSASSSCSSSCHGPHAHPSLVMAIWAVSTRGSCDCCFRKHARVSCHADMFSLLLGSWLEALLLGVRACFLWCPPSAPALGSVVLTPRRASISSCARQLLACRFGEVSLPSSAPFQSTDLFEPSAWKR